MQGLQALGLFSCSLKKEQKNPQRLFAQITWNTQNSLPSFILGQDFLIILAPRVIQAIASATFLVHSDASRVGVVVVGFSENLPFSRLCGLS